MKLHTIRTRVFEEGENIVRFITDHIPPPQEKSVIVVTSKIVALSESRTAPAGTLRDKERLIRLESEWALPTKYVWLTMKDEILMAAAGIDESNAKGKLILLPRDSFASARRIRKDLRRIYGLRHLGVLITDSRTTPLRAGVMGVALGYSGFRGLRDYRGRPDIFGRRFVFSQTDVADSLAAAAVLVMGEGAERHPLLVVEGAPVEFCDRVRRNELHIPIRDDMYAPLFAKLPRPRHHKK